MINTQLTARILLIVLILAFATLACVGGGGGEGSGAQATSQAAGVTATYGSEQYHQQLTAIYDCDDPTIQVTIIYYSTIISK